jgi:hypothetical protein
LGRFDRIYLEEDQIELLSWMVEVERGLSPLQRGAFLLVQTNVGSDTLIHNRSSQRRSARKGDLESLAGAALLRRDFANPKTPMYEVTPMGRLYYTEQMQTAKEATATVESDIHRFLAADEFRAKYPDAYVLWQRAEQGLWQAEEAAQFTAIGHVCREAIQAFASSLASSAGVIVPADPTKTVDRIRAVLEKLHPGSDDFSKALLVYWGVVSDLVMRQEHGARKEGDPLVWEDARRVVFQTVIVMFEISRLVDS